MFQPSIFPPRLQVIDIEIVKLGKQASDEVDASTTTVPPHNPVYHLEAALENVCYETTYIDAHYQENGFALGRCDESYDVIEEKRVEEVCDGHSEINIKYCPTSVIEIDVRANAMQLLLSVPPNVMRTNPAGECFS